MERKSTSDSGVADIEVKSSLFKDVKYYVAGTINPEASKPLLHFWQILFIHMSGTILMAPFSLFSDSKIARNWWGHINENYVHKHNAFIML